jgi:hypothetical protein
MAAQIYHMLYQNGQPPKIEHKFQSVSISTPMGPVLPEISSKKKQLIEALHFLKSKPNKTKQDRESMGMLEAAIKNQPD